MRKRDPDLGKALQGGGQFVPPLSLEFATAGGPQKIQCWNRDSQGMAPLKNDAQAGGAVAGRTRKDIEAQTGKPVISGGNFKKLSARKPKKLKANED